MELFFKEETYKLRGAIFEVYKDKGSGFLEDVYQECLQIELELQDIPFVAQASLDLNIRADRSLRSISLTLYAIVKLLSSSKR